MLDPPQSFNTLIQDIIIPQIYILCVLHFIFERNILLNEKSFEDGLKDIKILLGSAIVADRPFCHDIIIELKRLLFQKFLSF